MPSCWTNWLISAKGSGPPCMVPPRTSNWRRETPQALAQDRSTYPSAGRKTKELSERITPSPNDSSRTRRAYPSKNSICSITSRWSYVTASARSRSLCRTLAGVLHNCLPSALPLRNLPHLSAPSQPRIRSMRSKTLASQTHRRCSGIAACKTWISRALVPFQSTVCTRARKNDKLPFHLLLSQKITQTSNKSNRKRSMRLP